MKSYKSLTRQCFKSGAYSVRPIQPEYVEKIRQWRNEQMDVLRQTSYSGLHLYPIRLKLSELKVTHREVFDSQRAQGVGVNLHYIPVHIQPYYQSLGFKPGDFPESESYYAEAISLPMYPGLTIELQSQVLDALRKGLKV